jgi:hypothetical protein
VAATVELVTLQVIPPTVDTDLDDIARELLVVSLQLGQLALGADAAAVGLPQALAVDVGDETQALVVADRANSLDPLAQIATGSEQLGMGIADVGSVTASCSEIA